MKGWQRKQLALRVLNGRVMVIHKGCLIAEIHEGKVNIMPREWTKAEANRLNEVLRAFNTGVSVYCKARTWMAFVGDDAVRIPDTGLEVEL